MIRVYDEAGNVIKTPEHAAISKSGEVSIFLWHPESEKPQANKFKPMLPNTSQVPDPAATSRRT